MGDRDMADETELCLFEELEVKSESFGRATIVVNSDGLVNFFGVVETSAFKYCSVEMLDFRSWTRDLRSRTSE